MRGVVVLARLVGGGGGMEAGRGEVEVVYFSTVKMVEGEAMGRCGL